MLIQYDPSSKNINVASAIQVNKSSLKMKMLSMVSYRLYLIKYLLAKCLPFNKLVLKDDLLYD